METWFPYEHGAQSLKLVPFVIISYAAFAFFLKIITMQNKNIVTNIQKSQKHSYRAIIQASRISTSPCKHNYQTRTCVIVSSMFLKYHRAHFIPPTATMMSSSSSSSTNASTAVVQWPFALAIYLAASNVNLCCSSFSLGVLQQRPFLSVSFLLLNRKQ